MYYGSHNLIDIDSMSVECWVFEYELFLIILGSEQISERSKTSNCLMYMFDQEGLTT